MLYETVNTDYRQICIKQPFNDIMEDNCNGDGYITKVEVTDIKATVRNNTFGEMRLVELDYSYNLICRGYKSHCYSLTDDLYSTEYDSECRSSEISTCVLNGIFSSSLSVNDTREIGDLCDEELSYVVDCHATVAAFNIDVVKGNTVISGDVKYDLICKLATPENKYCHISMLVPYRYEREGTAATEEFINEHCVKITSSDVVIDKGRLVSSCELYFTVMTADVVKHRYISEVELKPCDLKEASPLLIYYPKGDDTLWDVAKKYKSTCRDIKSVNSLNDDSLNDIKVLLLLKKKQKAVFNSII